MHGVSATFQAGHAGSIPVTRSSIIQPTRKRLAPRDLGSLIGARASRAIYGPLRLNLACRRIQDPTDVFNVLAMIASSQSPT